MAIKMHDLPSQSEMSKNIIYTFLNASHEDMQEGMNWYPNALHKCAEIADDTMLPLDTVVALVSVISPSIMWGGNISAPEQIIDLWDRGIPATEWTGFNIYPANLLKAERILNGEISALKGNKVVAFYRNIMGSWVDVTIDRWSIRVALDEPKLGKDKIVPSGKKVYEAIADAYRESARLLGVAAPEVQAVTWTVFRNKYNGRVRKARARMEITPGAVPVMV